MQIDTTIASTPAEEELHLLGRVAAGDAEVALVDLYRRYASRLYGLGMRLLGDRGMAEDLVQETFVRLWRSAPRFDPERGSVRTFVFTIARRAAVDLMRRSASRPLATQEDVEIVDDRGFDSLLLSLEVRDAVETLSPQHRDVIELLLDEDLGQAQIAERLRIPLGTVKTRTFYGLRALRLELEERGLVA